MKAQTEDLADMVIPTWMPSRKDKALKGTLIKQTRYFETTGSQVKVFIQTDEGTVKAFKLTTKLKELMRTFEPELGSTVGIHFLGNKLGRFGKYPAYSLTVTDTETIH
jgi:hypothetical protein